MGRAGHRIIPPRSVRCTSTSPTKSHEDIAVRQPYRTSLTVTASLSFVVHGLFVLAGTQYSELYFVAASFLCMSMNDALVQNNSYLDQVVGGELIGDELARGLRNQSGGHNSQFAV